MQCTRDEALIRLPEEARQIRIEILKMLHRCGSGHTGGSLSATDLLTALFFTELRHRPEDPNWEDRDRFVLSKGHAAPLYYAILCRFGYIQAEELCRLRKVNCILQGHPDSKSTPGVEISTGSLGQGLSVANGMALGLRLNKNSSRVYVLLGDGEVQEGMVWEAAMTSAHYQIDNLCAILDRNGLQIDGAVEEVDTEVLPHPDPDKTIHCGFEGYPCGRNPKGLCLCFEGSGEHPHEWKNAVKGNSYQENPDSELDKGITYTHRAEFHRYHSSWLIIQM